VVVVWLARQHREAAATPQNRQKKAAGFDGDENIF
jgi:hypothetical protein